MSTKSELNLKNQLISLLEIADVNFLMSVKNVSPETVLTNINDETNSIAQIFGHCVRQMDNYLSRFSGELKIKPENMKIHELLDDGYSFGKFVDVYLEIFSEFVGYIKKVPENELYNPITKGEKLINIIQRISLHYMGHLGQISIIRKFLGNEIDGPYSFVKAMSKPTRRKLKNEWLEWWSENSTSYH
ncbi:MAG: DUF1572 family protein [Candidatus Kariarchaeaceae archaeon]|jgi:hypothetical protein